jgi:uncharacterized protein DUF930
LEILLENLMTRSRNDVPPQFAQRLVLANAMLVSGLLAGMVSTGTAQPLPDKQMLALDPSTRIEQRCNANGMGVVGREHKNLRPDELVAYAFADPAINGNTIRAPGAAIRSGNNWYHMSYLCETSDEGLRVKSFNYSLGAVIPREDWAEHGLVAP